jgi:hypothetical protein
MNTVTVNTDEPHRTAGVLGPHERPPGGTGPQEQLLASFGATP